MREAVETGLGYVVQGEVFVALYVLPSLHLLLCVRCVYIVVGSLEKSNDKPHRFMWDLKMNMPEAV